MVQGSYGWSQASIGKNRSSSWCRTWKPTEAIKEFAGKNPAKARYYPDDNKFLPKLEPRVKHYDFVFES